MEKMDIRNEVLCITCGTLVQGGTERIIAVLSKCFLGYFSRIEIILWQEAPVFYEFNPAVKIISVCRETKSKIISSHMLWFRKYIKRTTPYCVLSFLAPFNILSVIGLIGVPVRVFLASRSEPRYEVPGFFWKVVRNFVYSLADGISVQTERNKQNYPRRVREKIKVIHNPVFLSEKMIGKALDVPKEKIIVSVGRLTKAKNQFLLLEAFRNVLDIYPDYRLIVYGEGELREGLESKIKELNLEEYVSLPGAVTNVHEMILNAAMFVLTSDYEGMPNALIEAMCLGLPCISTRVSGTEELIVDKVNGLLVNIGDKAELIRAILFLIGSPDQASRLAYNGVKLANRLKMGAIIDQWLEFMKIENIED